MFVDSDLLQFHAYRTLTGGVRHADFCRRNGVLVPNFSRSWEGDATDLESEPSTWFVSALTANLTATERRTWLRLLDRSSITATAADEGVSRTAIYERIRGSSRGHGGMVAKNPFVALWWLRRRLNDSL